MTITRLGLRIAAVESLRNRTFVGPFVLDSEIGALRQRADGALEANQERRFIAVYTQNSDLTSVGFAPRGLRENGAVELIFEMGITAAMLVRDDDTGKQEVFEGMPATDAAFETYLDLLGHQIINCLVDPENEWAEIWRSFVDKVVKVERMRAASAQHVRLAGHQLKITCMAIDDPEIGSELDGGGAVARLLAKLEASDQDTMLAQAALIRTAIGTPNSDTWRLVQRTLGLTASEMTSLGLMPLDLDPEAQDFEAGSIEGDIQPIVTVTASDQ